MAALVSVAALAAAAWGASNSGGTSTSRPVVTTPVTTLPGVRAATLSDTGLGDLKLGVSLKKAKALGFVGNRANEAGEPCSQYTGKKGIKYLWFTQGHLAIIDIPKRTRMNTGIGIGSTFQQLHDVYGDRIGPDDGNARIYVSAPEAPVKAQYRIGLDTETAFRDSKIVEIALQSTDAACYE
ncbi:hypothetical protein [Kineosporia sp. NBRC 101731]|uniref:hypothetical protein n=1 Tax=Kineosporia sp. NBRC 101731 TaxID=3032199 RepID=UPI00255489E1|nr:hypothetical protein [Kineosporia sp. NBRC 101731]